MKFLKKNKKIFAIGLPAVIAVFALSFLSYTIVYANRIYPNTYLAGEKIGGMKKEALKKKLEQKIKNSSPAKAIFIFEQQSWEIPLSSIDFKYGSESSAQAAWAIGRRASFGQSLKEQVLAFYQKQNLEMEISFNEKKFNEELKKISQRVDIPERVFSFILKKGQIEIVSAKEGRRLLQSETKEIFSQKLGRFDNKIPLVVIQVLPKIQEQGENTAGGRQKFSQMIESGLTLTWGEEKFTLKPEELSGWAKFIEKETAPLKYILDLELDQDKVQNYLKSIAKKIDREPIDAKLSISDGLAAVFQAHQEGYRLNQQETFKEIKEILLGSEGNKREAVLKVETLKPAIRTETINELGIKELIGEGSTSFKGSPQNRIHNITVGANLFNGVMLKPGEEFSFNKILGEVSGARGFLPELVIKEDRLIPETGGGLCQVSSTMFRAAVYSGLDILERTAHSFRVRYYEPPVGLDATVYSPKPDLKFKNDTPGYILIQTKIEGTKLTFQFYGTKDGRTIEVKGPYTSDHRSPGAAVYIDDSSMPAGQTKQIEKAVPGLTAMVYWTVYRGGQILHQKKFVSKYVPWPAKYKKGTGPAPAPPPEQPPAESPPASPPPTEPPPSQQ